MAVEETTEPEKNKKPSENALLTEYQVLQQDASSSNTSFWTMTGIFVGFTSALLGGLVLGILSNKDMTGVILNGSEGSKEFLMLGIITWVIAMLVLVILCFLKSWYRRDRFLWQLNYRRMRQIELTLGMRFNLLISGLEEWKRLEAEIASWVESEQQETLKYEIKQEVEKLRIDMSQLYEPRTGRWHITGIFYTLIIVWALVLVGSFFLLYRYNCVWTIAMLVLTFVICLFILMKKPKRHLTVRSKLETH